MSKELKEVKEVKQVKQDTALLAIILALIIGFIAGREYMKYEIRTAMQDAFSNAFK